jgi:prepilin-type N-terminal cleavage/methylation domain-containing protein
MSRRRGFTLIEILAALMVLAIGLTSIIAIMTRSVQLSNNAADKNITRALINEAIADIERAHLITESDPPKSGHPKVDPAHPEHLNVFIETVTCTDDSIPTIHNAFYKDNIDVLVAGKTFGAQLNYLCGTTAGEMKCFSPPLNPSTTRMLLWPMSNAPKYLGGLSGLSASNTDSGSYAYRILYRLERDQRWVPHLNDCSDYAYDANFEDSPYAGLYQLTLVVYRDVDRHGGRLEQLTDPVVVYLRDKKVRP